MQRIVVESVPALLACLAQRTRKIPDCPTDKRQLLVALSAMSGLIKGYAQMFALSFVRIKIVGRNPAVSKGLLP